MLTHRLLVAIIGLPILVALIVIGGWPFIVLMAIGLGVAAWEFWRMFSTGGYMPSRLLLIGGVILLALVRGFYEFQYSDLLVTALILMTMAVHVFGIKSSANNGAVSFCITLAGLFYLGWLGSYFLLLRLLPDGEYWLLTVLPAVWLTDGGAFIIGRRFGRHYMAPFISPKKTWEGYAGGIVFAALGTPVLAMLWQLVAPGIAVDKALGLGLAIAIVAPMGDLGESMLKRQFGYKDSSNILPGHGGIMDRIDTWIWAAAIGYYFIAWM